MNDIEAEMLRRQREREAKAAQDYNNLFYQKTEAPALSQEAQSQFIKNMIATPATKPMKRILVMYGEKEARYQNLKDCQDKTGIRFQEIKGFLRASDPKPIYCKKWKCLVMFKFVYE